MSLAHPTLTQLRLLQLVCFGLPILAALVLSRLARQKRKFVFFRVVDAEGAPAVGVVSTVSGHGPRQKIRAIGRLDANGTFRREFSPFEPQTLLVSVVGIEGRLLPVSEVAGASRFDEHPRILTVKGGALAAPETEA